MYDDSQNPEEKYLRYQRRSKDFLENSSRNWDGIKDEFAGRITEPCQALPKRQRDSCKISSIIRQHPLFEILAPSTFPSPTVHKAIVLFPLWRKLFSPRHKICVYAIKYSFQISRLNRSLALMIEALEIVDCCAAKTHPKIIFSAFATESMLTR